MGPGPLQSSECCLITLTVCGYMTDHDVAEFNKALGKLLKDPNTKVKSVVRGQQPPPAP